jgi:hypothetical protein
MLKKCSLIKLKYEFLDNALFHNLRAMDDINWTDSIDIFY